MKHTVFEIDNLQFYWRLKNSPEEKNIVPDFLSFTLAYDDKLGLFFQKPSKKILNALNEIYKEEYNIGNIQEIFDWGTEYTQDFVDFMNSVLSRYDKEIKKILEVGCGAGMLLEIFQNQGYRVIGIDPSALTKIQGKKRGVKVIVDYYPSEKIKGKFDVVYHSDVLEHMSNPVKFLKENFDQLNEGGLVILTVPDSSESILSGDISMVYHQHMNYFDKESLNSVLEAAGFSDIYVVKAKFGGSLNAYAMKNKKYTSKKISNSHESKLKNYIHKNKLIVKNIKKYVKEVQKNKKRTIGFYAPVRALPYIALLRISGEFRFFDDATKWHQKYLDGIPVKVENIEDLKRNPVTDIFIMSPTFGKEIEQKIKKYFRSGITVYKLIDFYK